jgi:hypothetical protein
MLKKLLIVIMITIINLEKFETNNCKRIECIWVFDWLHEIIQLNTNQFQLECSYYNICKLDFEI